MDACRKTADEPAWRLPAGRQGRQVLIIFCNLAGWRNSITHKAASRKRYVQPVRHSDFKLPERNLHYFDILTLTTQYKNLL